LDLKALGAAWRGVAVLPPRRQLAMLAAAVAALLVAALWVAWAEYREAHFGDHHVAAAGEMRMLSQRLAKSALRSLRGDPDAFPLVQASRDGFAAALARLARDGRAPNAVQALATEWERSERNATTLLRDQKLLTALAAAAAGMERANPQLLERAGRHSDLAHARPPRGGARRAGWFCSRSAWRAACSNCSPRTWWTRKWSSCSART
jgi:hypothetical protein